MPESNKEDPPVRPEADDRSLTRYTLGPSGFAHKRIRPAHVKRLYPYKITEFSVPITNPPAQRHLFHNKIHNLRLAGQCFNGLVIEPGQICSFWHLVGEPTAARGFREAAVLINGKLLSSMGGSICQLSGVLYNVALMTNMAILERHAHSVDAYGEARYVPLGRDATLVYKKKDISFYNSNPFSLALFFTIEDKQVLIRGFSSCKPSFDRIDIISHELSVIPPPTVVVEDSTIDRDQEVVDHPGYCGREVETFRVVHYRNGDTIREKLSYDRYRMIERQVRRSKDSIVR